MKLDIRNIASRIFSSDYFKGALLLFLIQLFLFNPVYVEDKVFLSGDAVSAANAKAPLDAVWEESSVYPFWQPYVFSGMPSFESLTFNRFVYLPAEILMGIRWLLHLPHLFPQLFHIFLAGLFTFIFLKKRGISQAASLLGGVIFMMNPYLVTMIVHGHGSQASSVAYIPLALLAISEHWRKPSLVNAGATALVLGLQLQRAHIQIVYYTWMLAGLYLLYSLIADFLKEKDAKVLGKKLGSVVGALIIAFGLAAVLYLPVYYYTDWSIRGGGAGGGVGLEYATQWSFSPKEVMTFFNPSFYGFGGNTYWGGMPFTDYPNYMGILALGLAVYAAVRVKRRLVIILGLTAVLSLMISFGRHFSLLYEALYNLLPFFNKFRVPAMILILLQLSVALMAGFGLDALIKDTKAKSSGKKKQYVTSRASRGLLYGLIGVVAVMVLIALFSGSIESSFMQIRRAARGATQQQLSLLNIERYRLFMRDFWIVSLIVLGFLATVYFRLKSGYRGFYLGAAAILLTLIDLGRVDLKITEAVGYQPAGILKADGRQSTLTRFLNSQEKPFRVFPTLNLFRSKEFAAQGLESIGGYHPAKLKHYQAFLEKVPFGRTFVRQYYKQVENGRDIVPRGVEEQDRRRIEPDLKALAMLSVKYVVSPYPINEPTFRLLRSFNEGESGFGVPVLLYEYNGTLPRAWLVNRHRVVADEEEALSFLRSPGFDPAAEVVLFEKPGLLPDSAATGDVELLRISPREIALTVETSGTMFLVLSEIYYPPGWRAEMDGEPVEIRQSDYILRGVGVPAGKHELIFYNTPAGFTIGLYMTIASYMIVAVVFISGVLSRYRKSAA